MLCAIQFTRQVRDAEVGDRRDSAEPIVFEPIEERLRYAKMPPSAIYCPTFRIELRCEDVKSAREYWITCLDYMSPKITN